MTNIHDILKHYWNHDQFRPLQEEIINSVLEGRDTLALLPTGGGKSVCFQVPALARDGICIVVSPLIALMQDQVDNLKRKGIPAIAITSAMRKKEIDVAFDNCIYGKTRFLYLSPERLQTELARVRISRMNVNLLAVDEAHCISQWGYDFRPPYLQIAEMRELLPNVPILALTATATLEVEKDIAEKLELRNPNIVKGSFARTNLSYIIRETEDKLSRLLRVSQTETGSGIVYVRNRRRTQELAVFLQRNGISSTFYHAGLTANDRTQRQQLWLSNQARVMVATNAFGMGIDKPDVRFVVHYDLPDSPEAYFQEAGRGGRDGQHAYAALFWNNHDIKDLRHQLTASFPPLEEIRRTYQALANLYEIPVGAGEGVTYIFNQQRLCDTYNLDKTTVFNSLRFLEREGYIAVSDAVFQPSKIMVIAGREDLYRFEVANIIYEPLIKLLLRSYSGLFDQFAAINEFQLAKRLGRPQRDVIKWLNELHQHELIHYIPQNDQPLLTFITPRAEAKYLYISPVNLAQRKKAAEVRVEAMTSFVKETNHCRQAELLAYFGEINAADCGKCDVCRNKTLQPNLRTTTEKIVTLIKEKTRTIHELVQLIPDEKERELIQLVRELADKGQLKIEEDKIRSI